LQNSVTLSHSLRLRPRRRAVPGVVVEMGGLDPRLVRARRDLAELGCYSGTKAIESASLLTPRWSSGSRLTP